MTQQIKNLTENLTDNLIQIYGLRPLFLKIILSSSFLMVVLYLGILTAIAGSSVEIRKNANNIQALINENQKTESAYFSLTEKIDLDYAKSLGYVVQNSAVQYASRNVVSGLALLK